MGVIKLFVKGFAGLVILAILVMTIAGGSSGSGGGLTLSSGNTIISDNTYVTDLTSLNPKVPRLIYATSKTIVTSPFGTRIDPITGDSAYHHGTDFSCALGEPIKAAATGTVERIVSGCSVGDMSCGELGNNVTLDHGNGIKTQYAHLSAVSMSVGQMATQGDEIGKCGSTGKSTGNHLHLVLWIDNKQVNILPYLKR